MFDWWASFADEWTWSSPTNVLGAASILVTALIPLFLWRLSQAGKAGRRSARVKPRDVV